MTTPAPKTPSANNTRTRREADAAEESQAPVGSSAPEETEQELADLAQAREEATRRTEELLVSRVLREARSDDGQVDDRTRQLVLSARQDLLTELRAQEREQARRQLADAASSGEDAVAGMIRGVTTIVRTLVPAAWIRPEEFIETSFALADQSLRVVRRMALVAAGSVRTLVG